MESPGEQVFEETQTESEPGVASVDGWAECYNLQSDHHKACLDILLGFGILIYLQVPEVEVVEVVIGDETPSQTNKPLIVASGGLSVFDIERAYHIRFLCDWAEKVSP